jgi:hypothetical protein
MVKTQTDKSDTTTPTGSIFRLTFWTGVEWHTVYVRAVDPPVEEDLTSVLLLTETAKLEALT